MSADQKITISSIFQKWLDESKQKPVGPWRIVMIHYDESISGCWASLAPCETIEQLMKRVEKTQQSPRCRCPVHQLMIQEMLSIYEIWKGKEKEYNDDSFDFIEQMFNIIISGTAQCELPDFKTAWTSVLIGQSRLLQYVNRAQCGCPRRDEHTQLQQLCCTCSKIWVTMDSHDEVKIPRLRRRGDPVIREMKCTKKGLVECPKCESKTRLIYSKSGNLDNDLSRLLYSYIFLPKQKLALW
jgi:hypothetical protein